MRNIPNDAKVLSVIPFDGLKKLLAMTTRPLACLVIFLVFFHLALWLMRLWHIPRSFTPLEIADLFPDSTAVSTALQQMVARAILTRQRRSVCPVCHAQTWVLPTTSGWNGLVPRMAFISPMSSGPLLIGYPFFWLNARRTLSFLAFFLKLYNWGSFQSSLEHFLLTPILWCYNGIIIGGPCLLELLKFRGIGFRYVGRLSSRLSLASNV